MRGIWRRTSSAAWTGIFAFAGKPSWSRTTTHPTRDGFATNTKGCRKSSRPKALIRGFPGSSAFSSISNSNRRSPNSKVKSIRPRKRLIHRHRRPVDLRSTRQHATFAERKAAVRQAIDKSQRLGEITPGRAKKDYTTGKEAALAPGKPGPGGLRAAHPWELT